MEDFEAKYERLAEERDSAERAMSQAYYLITGKSPEWSNIFGYEEALEEINTAQYLLRTEEGPMIKRYWTTFHDGFYCLEIAPEGKGFWVKYLDHVKELEQEQASHAETRKLLLKACEKRDAQRIDDYRAGYSCGFNDHLRSRGIRDLEAAEKYFGITHPTPPGTGGR